MATRYQGLKKIAQVQEPEGVRDGFLGRAMGAYSDFRRAHPNLGRVADAGISTMPGMAMAPHMPGILNRWENFSNNHPVASTALGFVPLAGAIPFGLDATNALRHGNYLSAAGNALGMGAAVFGGGAAARALGSAGRLARLGRGVRGATKIQRGLSRVPGMGMLGKGVENRLMSAGTAMQQYTAPFATGKAVAGMIGLPIADAALDPDVRAGMKQRWQQFRGQGNGQRQMQAEAEPVPYGTGGFFTPQLPPSRFRGLAFMNPYEDPATLPFGGMPSGYWNSGG